MKAVYGTYEIFQEVTHTINELLQKRVIKFTVCNELFGDVVPGKVKMLRMIFGSGLVKVFSENEIVAVKKALSENYMKDKKTITYMGNFFTNKRGLEIGGPSYPMLPLGVYTTPSLLDNVNFSY